MGIGRGKSMLLKNEPEKVIQEIFHRFCGKGVEMLTQVAHNIIKLDDLVKSLILATEVTEGLEKSLYF
jgi:hypothetical protein